ncbi:uncharacterized protein G2W53_007371 [Senna tora]|uniref:Uncharacterized protein n=1 Tax=Senna tora TaxID=362788 RepID=A0A835CE58_9FABA|nr:uncharacterized protein G2W53_007371 [Senna tora]
MVEEKMFCYAEEGRHKISSNGKRKMCKRRNPKDI